MLPYTAGISILKCKMLHLLICMKVSDLNINLFSLHNNSPGFTCTARLFEDEVQQCVISLVDTQNVCRLVTELEISLFESKDNQFSGNSSGMYL